MLPINSIVCGDNLTVMKTFPDNCIDAIVCDPPYALTTTARWKDTSKFAENQSDVGKRFSKGFMGKEWDGKLPGIEVWQECLRVAKPGAHMLAFGGTRTHHRLMVAIEDAGWEIRDTLGWLYGSGFPKSLNIGKAVDKLQGNVREVVGEKIRGDVQRAKETGSTFAVADANKNNKSIFGYGVETLTKGTSPHEGWGTNLKPAWEPIILCRKPLEGTVANNVLKWGVGGINIDGCRVESSDNTGRPQGSDIRGGSFVGSDKKSSLITETNPMGRFPANLIHDGSEEVLGIFPDTKSVKSKRGNGIGVGYHGSDAPYDTERGFDDSGSAARFFYCAKASKSERGIDNKHPTVKPLSLMRYLCKLITPPKGIILDPFMGSGSTGVAAYQEGFEFTGFELEKDSFDTASFRIKKAHEQGKVGT